MKRRCERLDFVRHHSHEALVNALYERMSEDKRYLYVEKESRYPLEGPEIGRFDIFAITKDRHTRYYEVKSHYSPHAVKRAKEQFQRAYRHFWNGRDTQYILYTPQRGFMRFRAEVDF